MSIKLLTLRQMIERFLDCQLVCWGALRLDTGRLVRSHIGDSRSGPFSLENRKTKCDANASKVRTYIVGRSFPYVCGSCVRFAYTDLLYCIVCTRHFNTHAWVCQGLELYWRWAVRPSHFRVSFDWASCLQFLYFGAFRQPYMGMWGRIYLYSRNRLVLYSASCPLDGLRELVIHISLVPWVCTVPYTILRLSMTARVASCQRNTWE